MEINRRTSPLSPVSPFFPCSFTCWFLAAPSPAIYPTVLTSGTGLRGGSRDGTLVWALPPTNVAQIRFPNLASCGLSFLLVLILAPRFFSGPPVFPPSSKINIAKFQFDLEFESHRFVSLMTIKCHTCLSKLSCEYEYMKIIYVNIHIYIFHYCRVYHELTIDHLSMWLGS